MSDGKVEKSLYEKNSSSIYMQCSQYYSTFIYSKTRIMIAESLGPRILPLPYRPSFDDTRPGSSNYIASVRVELQRDQSKVSVKIQYKLDSRLTGLPQRPWLSSISTHSPVLERFHS